MNKLITLGLAAGLTLALASCGGSGGDTIKFGIGGPITGSEAAFGAQLKNGAEQAIADINEAGGILGKKISIFYGDDVADPKQGVSVANKFAADGVKFVVGHFNSGVTMPASEIYQENGILEITPAATNPRITERNMWNIFRTCGRDDQQGAVAGDYIAANFKDKKVAVVHDKTTYGQGLADETKKTMNAKGIQEVLYEGVNANEKDYSALVSKIKSAGADLVYWGGLHTAGGLIVRQMRDQGVNAVLMGGDGITSDEFATIGGPGVEGTLMTYGPDPRRRVEAKPVVEKFRAKNFEPESLHALQLRRGADHQGGGGGSEIPRSQEGRRSDAFGQEILDRHRRHQLRQEGRRHPARLRDVCLEEGRQREDHLYGDRSIRRSPIRRSGSRLIMLR